MPALRGLRDRRSASSLGEGKAQGRETQILSALGLCAFKRRLAMRLVGRRNAKTRVATQSVLPGILDDPPTERVGATAGDPGGPSTASGADNSTEHGGASGTPNLSHKESISPSLDCRRLAPSSEETLQD